MVEIRGIEIGAERPKICVPITGSSKKEILEQASKIAPLSVEIVEWRVDYTQFIRDKQQVAEVLSELREVLGEKVLLFTIRSKKEGGEQELSVEEYLELNVFAAETGMVDIIDLELYTESDSLLHVMEVIHNAGCKIIMSNHDFEKTPNEKVLLERLSKMEQMGADILKIAAMPQKPEDVITVLSATCEAVKQFSRPVVTMSMSKLGVISRLTGGIFGSVITFGTVGEASAPGQVPVEELNQYLDFFSL